MATNREANPSPQVNWEFQQAINETGEVLKAAVHVVKEHPGPPLPKVGVTAAPETRRYSGYGEYLWMFVLAQTGDDDTPEQARDAINDLERLLIDALGGTVANERGGGGGRHEGDRLYLYIVAGSAEKARLLARRLANP